MTQKLIEQQLTQHILTESDLAHLFPGTDAARYAIINKACKKNEIIRLKRGLYIINKRFQTKPFSLYQIANALIPESYVTAEAALAYHQWIPERVHRVTSVISDGNKKIFSNPMGEFEYRKIPTQPYEFFSGVIRVIHAENPVLIASPARAILDLAYLSRMQPISVEWLYDSLRIEPEHVKQLPITSLISLRGVYKSKKVNQFLEHLIKVLGPSL